MKNIIFLFGLMIFNSEIVVFDFDTQSNVNQWYQTNDDVMGGISNSKMSLDNSGNGVFFGKVSTDNNGGFAMTRLPVNISLDDHKSKIVLKLKGDGKKYQFRIKSKSNQRFWYVQSFQTSTKNEEIELPLSDFYASFRGYELNENNFSETKIKEIAILIGNKKNEEFKLEIDKITIR